MAKRKGRSSFTAKKLQVKTSNDNSHMCYCCDFHGYGWLFVILGILYLFVDLGWITWWTISWWTIVFLLYGVKLVKR